MTWRRKTGLAAIVVLVSIMGALLAVLTVGAIGHCSILTGECQYDPRTQSPNPLYISQPPEGYVLQYLNDQIRQNGTFPSTATSPVSAVTPLLVTAHGFYTDWHVQADVRVRIDYANASSLEGMFESMEKSGGPVLGIEGTTMGVEYGPLSECDNPSAGHWLCR